MISIGPGGSSLEMLLLSVASAPVRGGVYKILTPLLLKHGADASKKNRDGYMPLDLVKEGDQVRGMCTKFLRPCCGGKCQTPQIRLRRFC
jgi:hypothetical protein